MRKITSYCILFFAVSSVHAVSFSQAQQVYNKLAKVNGISVPRLKISYDSSINAMATADSVYINTGMLKYLRNADELALVLGHEIGHVVMHGGGETNADDRGARYMQHAGYNVCHGAQALKRLHSPGDGAHPPSSQRYKHLGCK